MKNKKGLSGMIIGLILIIAVVFIILLAKGGFASQTITSGTKKVAGCKSELLAVMIRGIAYSRDTAYFGVIAEPDRVSIESVKVGGQALRAFNNQDYTYTVRLYDQFNGNVVAQDQGDNIHPGGGILTTDPFSLGFLIPDNDCNGIVDDFSGRIVYEVTTENGEVNSVDTKLDFVNGKLIRG